MSVRLKLVDRLILTEVGSLFIVGVIVFTSIILIATSANLINYLTQGIPPWVVLQLIGFNIMPWLVTTFPMAMLLSTIIGFVRLSTQSEIVALFAAGVPFRRLVAPVVVFSAFVTVLALYTNDTISPYATREFNEIKQNAFHEIGETTKPFDIPAVRDNSGRLMILAHVEGGYDIDTQSMRDVYIVRVDPMNGQIVATIHAVGAKWLGGDNWRLENGSVEMNGTYSRFQTAGVQDLRQPPDSIALLENGPDTLDFRQLFTQIDQLKATGDRDDKTVRDAEVSLWDKISLPFACFTFAIIGAPLGLRPQRTSALAIAFVIGLGIIFAYYALYQYMHVLGASGHANPAVAAFLPDLMALCIGLALLGRSSS